MVIPAYREKPEIVEGLYFALSQLGAEVIIVDDGGYMDLQVPKHSIPHKGYGYAIKYGILQAKNNIICTMDGDGEHTIEDVEKLYKVFNLITDCSMVVGCRWNLKEKPIRWIGRKLINLTASLWAKHFMVDLNSGMRIFKRDLAISYSQILCDVFSFTTSLTMCIVNDGYKVAWFPIDNKPRVYGKSRVNLFRDGLVTIYYIFWIGFALRTRSIRKWLRNLKPIGSL